MTKTKSEMFGESINALEKLQVEQIKNLRKLEKSLAVKEFDPNAFDQGRIHMKVIGDIERYPKSCDLVFLSKAGDHLSIHPLLSVPFKIWPEYAQELYLSPRYRTRRKIPALQIVTHNKKENENAE